MSMRLSGVRVFLPGVCRVLRSFPLLLFLLVIYLVFFLMRYDTTVLSSAQHIGELDFCSAIRVYKVASRGLLLQ